MKSLRHSVSGFLCEGLCGVVRRLKGKNKGKISPSRIAGRGYSPRNLRGGLCALVPEGANLAVPGFPLPLAAPDIETNVVVIRGAVDGAAVDFLPGPAELAVPVDFVLIDLMQDGDLAAFKAKLG